MLFKFVHLQTIHQVIPTHALYVKIIHIYPHTLHKTPTCFNLSWIKTCRSFDGAYVKKIHNFNIHMYSAFVGTA